MPHLPTPPVPVHDQSTDATPVATCGRVEFSGSVPAPPAPARLICLSSSTSSTPLVNEMLSPRKHTQRCPRLCHRRDGQGGTQYATMAIINLSLYLPTHTHTHTHPQQQYSTLCSLPTTMATDGTTISFSRHVAVCYTWHLTVDRLLTGHEWSRLKRAPFLPFFT